MRWSTSKRYFLRGRTFLDFVFEPVGLFLSFKMTPHLLKLSLSQSGPLKCAPSYFKIQQTQPCRPHVATVKDGTEIYRTAAFDILKPSGQNPFPTFERGGWRTAYQSEW